MDFYGEVVKFNIYDAMKYPANISCICSVDVIDSLQQKHFDLCFGDKLSIILGNTLNINILETLEENYATNKNLQEAVFELDLSKHLKVTLQILIFLFLTLEFHILFFKHLSWSKSHY